MDEVRHDLLLRLHNSINPLSGVCLECHHAWHYMSE
jgi:hypothetical protein